MHRCHSESWLSLKLEKCGLAAKSGMLLCDIVQREGIIVDPTRVKVQTIYAVSWQKFNGTIW